MTLPLYATSVPPSGDRGIPMRAQPQAGIQNLRAELQRRLGEILSVLVKGYKPKRVTLFGSWAKGDFTEESDIDLLIVKSTRKNRLERAWEVSRLLSHKKNHPMDVIVLTPAEIRKRLKAGDPFIQEVERDGIILYQDGG